LVSWNQLRYVHLTNEPFGQEHLDEHSTLKKAEISQQQPTSEDQMQHIQRNCFQTILPLVKAWWQILAFQANVLIPVINKKQTS
jgi:hypothetical protein